MRRYRFVYQTPIRPFYRDALAKGASEAMTRALKYTGPSGIGYAFRVDDVVYSVVVDPDRDEYGVSRQIEIVAFPVLKRTDKGFRIRIGGWDHNPETRWISFAWARQWASLTPGDAMRSYIARRQKQARIYDSRAAIARSLVADAERILRESGEAPDPAPGVTP